MVSSLRIQATSTAVVITPMPLMLLRCSAGSLKWFRMWVFIFQRFDDINVFFALRVSRVQPVLLSNWHCDQLVSANDYGIKNLTFCIRQSPDKAVSFRMVINNCSHLGKKRASCGSVFARYPIARAKSRACLGLTTAISKPSG